ncbi:hypothetical protein DFR79_10842 [Halanaerobium saccharolyticum]|uniref:EamA-like transporter family protein n=1 Tax=Halanaerobium saccharolyticum TaxID=43595 RepID=A0A4R6LVD6_9FIRM|nr:hypothetical protein [Halanaerobium saccharolyticum]TDO92016.1 hypothetical protein DFR79_10842 [Halanaerobium saccharolyticum]
MIYLLLAVLCSSSIALIFKFSESNDLYRYIITSANYFAAAGYLFFGEKLKSKEWASILMTVIALILINI